MNIYQQNGYKDRKEYLMSLADEYGFEYETVLLIANLYGPSEDFDGLISSLEDMHE